MPRKNPTPYKKNVTVGLEHTPVIKFDPQDHELERDHICRQVEAAQSFILWHAARRMDLFFYLMIVYWNTKKTLAIGETRFQHGKGSRKYKTQAVHSSLFPYVVDQVQKKRFLMKRAYWMILIFYKN